VNPRVAAWAVHQDTLPSAQGSQPGLTTVQLVPVRAPVPRVSGVRSNVPPALSAVVHRALAKDPGERWQTAAAMREALLDAVK